MNVYILNKFGPPLFLWPKLMPLHVVVWIGTDYHHEVELPLLVVRPLKMTTFSRYTLTKQRIAILNLEAALIHIYHV
jgi:hypothetical protein